MYVLTRFRNVSGKIKKHIQEMSKEKMLDVIIAFNEKIVNYLDVTFDLGSGTYKPSKKQTMERNTST